ncbi:MAG: hypothetical protein ACR2QH_09845 [Geminicoccaceae bacterium]
MNARQRTGRLLTHVAWVSATALVTASCSLLNTPIESAGAPNSTQDNDSGGGH